MSEEHVTEGGVWGGYCNARVGHIQVHWIAGGMVRWGSPKTPPQKSTDLSVVWFAGVLLKPLLKTDNLRYIVYQTD